MIRCHARHANSRRLLAVAGVVSALSCVLALSPAAPGGSTSTDPDAFVRAVARLRPAVVAVGSYDAKDAPSLRYFGTAFVVHDGRTAVTNAHVVEGLRKTERLDRARVFFPDDAAERTAASPTARPLEGRPASVWIEDPQHDLALLRFEGPPGSVIELSEGQPPAGRSVGVVGYPIGTVLGLVPAAHRGVVAAVVPAVLPLPKGAKLTPELAEAIRSPYNLYQLDLLVFPGNSGSPLFETETGQVIGIINKTLATRTREHLLEQPSGIAYAVPSRWIVALLRRATLQGAAGAATQPSEPSLPSRSTGP